MLALPTKSVSFLAFYVAHRKGFYRDEGIDLEPILMQPSLASTAVLTGDLDYNGAVTGVIGAAVAGPADEGGAVYRRASAAIFDEQKRTERPARTQGQENRRQFSRRHSDISHQTCAKNYGLDVERDVFLNPMGGTGASRLAALESGVVDAVILESPDNILAQQKGFRELIFFGDSVEFPQNGFGTSEKKLKENPDEVFKMVRATLRGLMFSWDKKNRDQVLDIIMREMKPIAPAMANESFEQIMRVITKDGSVKAESIQVLIDLVRENAKVTRPVTVNQVVDFSFLEKAQKELGLR